MASKTNHRLRLPQLTAFVIPTTFVALSECYKAAKRKRWDGRSKMSSVGVFRVLAAGAFFVGLIESKAAYGGFSEEEFQLSTQQIASLAAAFDASISTAGGRFVMSGIAGDMDVADDLLRLESNWTFEQEGAPHRWRVGDTVSHPGTWGSAVRFAGVQFGTRFNLRSDLLYSKRLPLAGVAILPSTLDAVLASHGAWHDSTSHRSVPRMSSPTIAAANGLSFAARDAVGRGASFTGPLLAKHETAEPGCKHFSIGVGRARQDYALVSDSYGPLFANTTVQCGVGSGFTVEAHGDYLEDHASVAGLNVQRPIPLLGSASVAVAASENELGSGWLVDAGLQHSNGILEVNLRARLQSPEFRELGDVSAVDAVEQRMLATVGAKLGDRGVLALAYANQTTFALRRTNIFGMTQTIDLGRRGTLSVVANRSINDDEADGAVKLSYSLPLRN
jgi:outer membrane usher protein FimD/PapC